MVGFFDSGVGGLSILQAVRKLIPNISTVYFSDAANFPYGKKSEDDVKKYSLRSAEILMKYNPQAIVVACNTASTLALGVIREKFHTVPIIGVVPAIKPAVAMSKIKKVAVLATTGTLTSNSYHELKKSFANDVEVIDQACPGWVELVENGHVEDEIAEQAVAEIVKPLVEKGVDVFVLGCTHYPFLRPVIEKCAGYNVIILDSGEAVARQLNNVLSASVQNNIEHKEIFLTSGDVGKFQGLASMLMKREIVVERVM